MNLLSQYVKIFPFAKYRSSTTQDITSRLFYEQNVSNLIRQIIDTQGFIISGGVTFQGITNSDASFCFNLYGYYFEISPNVNLIPPEGQNSNYIIASIKMQERQPNLQNILPPLEIEGQDNSEGVFEPLVIEAVNILPSEGIYLVLLEKDSSDNWHVYEDSYSKFDVMSLNITGIDGKH